ncbi:MAG TPA: hypothetical protein PKB13_09925 [Clostridia bacterium]|nr:hypothetical protein [Clostridia bacterium]
MKKIVVLMLACAMLLSFAGCGIKEKAEQMAAEGFVEGILEQNGAADVDIDGDTMTIEGEDGSTVTFGSEWPDSELGKSIPEFTKGKIDGSVVTEESLMITIVEVSQEDAVAYIEENKPNFPLENSEMNIEGMISWGGENDAGFKLTLTHQDETFSIVLVKADE